MAQKINFQTLGIDFKYSNGSINFRKLQEQLCVQSSRLIKESYACEQTNPTRSKELVRRSHELDKVIKGIQGLC